jgi:hypothetical protein
LRRSVGAIALVFGVGSSACSDQALEVQAVESGDNALVHQGRSSDRATILEALELWVSPETGRFEAPHETPNIETPAVEVAAVAKVLPYQCENFEVVVNKKGKLRHRRLRNEWSQEDRMRFKKLVEMVAEEMGADPRLLRLWALRESTYNPHAIHVLNPDLRAADRSWERHRYTPEKAARLEAIMRRSSAKKKPYWKAKSELARLTKFKENPHFFGEVEFDLVYADGTRAREKASRWSYGYGPFGFNPTYFLPLWDVEAPPWVFCNDDGISAVVTAVWAARRAQRECRSEGYGDSYEAVNRRFSSGSCRPRPERAAYFRKRARAWGINPASKAKLGKRWPDSSDRGAVVAHMRERALEQDLLSRYATH